MACNTKPGPAIAIAFLECHIGDVKLTQKDWHALREAAGKGERLSNAIAGDALKANTARSLATSLSVSPEAADHFILSFMDEVNTVGTCDALMFAAKHGLPESILDRPRRKRGRVAGSVTMNHETENDVRITEGSVETGEGHNGDVYCVVCNGSLVAVSMSHAETERLADKYLCQCSGDTLGNQKAIDAFWTGRAEKFGNLAEYDPSTFAGLCESINNEFALTLQDEGLDSMVCDYLARGSGAAAERYPHTVCISNGVVYDFTYRQVAPDAPIPYVTSLSDWELEWETSSEPRQPEEDDDDFFLLI